MSNAQNILFNPPTGKLWRGLFGKKLLIALSGGKDSIALLHYLWRHRELAKWEIAACHINHNLRGEESLRDELFCRDWCLDKGIAFTAVATEITISSRGLEDAARVARYRLLEGERARLGYDFILTAHTADDQLESFFVDLLTGASIYTLGGINAVNDRVVRPIIDVSTEMIVQYLDANRLSCVFDSSNAEITYKRNLVRSEIIPNIRQYGDMLETIERIQQESRFLNEYFTKSTADIAIHNDGMVIIDRERFDRLIEPERRFLLGKWLSSLCRGGTVHVTAVLEQLGRVRSARLSMPERHLCEVTPRTIRIFPDQMVAPFKIAKGAGVRKITLPNGRVVELNDELTAKELIIRSRADGDRLGKHKLKDLFNDKTIDLFDRDRAIVAEEDGTLVWVEGIM
ncbi:MAG: tRNA lysidine(34) synthetase TilS [Deferribacteraceae bacterium]|jgi:tRNA(Ile)-lysidine synthase|nr:tRNA lysidine(34) synthetase TilS [Deferribacteraceae bacterium]